MNRKRFPSRHRCDTRQLSVVCLVAVPCSCSGDVAQYRFDDYRKNLAQSLKLDTPEEAEPLYPVRRPRKRGILLEQGASQITILDFLRLYDCALGEVIGETAPVC